MNEFREAQKNIRFISSVVQGLMALDERLGKASDLQKLVDEMEATRVKLAVSLEDMQGQLKEAEESKAAIEASLSTLTEEVKKEAAAAKAAAVKDIKDRYARLADDENAANARLAAIQGDVETAEAKLQQTREEMNSLFAKLRG